MILGDELARRNPTRSRPHRADPLDPTDREAFVVSLPKQLLAESTAPWPRWLAPPGSRPRLPTPVSGGHLETTQVVPGLTPAYARRSSLEIPAPARA